MYYRDLIGSTCSVGACLYLKADLGEFGTTFAFPASGHARHPCFLCHQPAQPRIVFGGWDVISSPYRDKTFDDYVAAAERCEFWKRVTRSDYVVLKRRFLQYDKRTGSNSSRGLALVDDYPPLELKKGDRVEEISGAIDCQDFYGVTVFPVDICFWRPSMETVTQHRNPLFSEETGITPLRSTALDWLHVLSLGIFQSFVSFATHRLVRADAWETNDDNMSSRMVVSMSRLGSALEAWQNSQARLGRDVTWCFIKTETFGRHDKPKCMLKGAQTNWYLEYLVDVWLPLRRHLLGDDAGPIFRAGQCLIGLLSLIRRHPVTFPVAAIQEFHDYSFRYLELIESLGLRAKPKDHCLQHMSLRICEQGSPALYANWLDESLNKLLREVSAHAHSSVHDVRVLKEFQKAYEGQANAKTRRLR